MTSRFSHPARLGARDDLVPESDVATLAQKLQSQRHIEIDYRVIKGANHLFNDKVEILGKTVESYLDEHLEPLDKI